MRNRPAHEALGLRFDRLSPGSQAALAMLLAALWLLGRRYGGLVQDAPLYLLQGLRRLDPGTFGKDLFFAYGSQDAYTAFPYLYAPLIDVLGAGPAATLVTLAGQAAFVGASLALVRRIAAGPARWWCLALVAVISGYYGGVGTHRLAEPFATARSLAEPLVIAALACTLSARHWLALASLALAAALHPLMAAPGIAVVFLWHAAARQRLGWSAALLAATAAIAVPVANTMTRSFDPPWLAVVLDRSPQLFLSQWQLPDWSRLLWGLCVAWLAAPVVALPVRRLVLASAAVCVAGVTASGIAVDLLNNATAAALQMWRAHWLLHVLAIMLVPVAVTGLWRSGNAARAAAACLAASCCFGRAEQPAAAALAVAAAVLVVVERRSPGWMGERSYRYALLAVACMASVGLLFEVQSRLPNAYDIARLPDWTDYVHAAASVGGLLPFAGLAWLAAHSRYRGYALAVSVAAFALGLATWDARKPWPRFIEQASAGSNPFREVLPADAVVYWPGPYGKSWLALGKPSWISVDQGAGVVFNRGTAIEYARRVSESAALQSATDNCMMSAEPSCRISVQPAQSLCARPGGPSHLVLNGRIDGVGALADWRLPAGIRPGASAFYLYSCRELAGKG